jgi:hypothetical protein
VRAPSSSAPLPQTQAPDAQQPPNTRNHSPGCAAAPVRATLAVCAEAPVSPAPAPDAAAKGRLLPDEEDEEEEAAASAAAPSSSMVDACCVTGRAGSGCGGAGRDGVRGCARATGGEREREWELSVPGGRASHARATPSRARARPPRTAHVGPRPLRARARGARGGVPRGSTRVVRAGESYGNRRRARPAPVPALAGPRGRPHGGLAALSVRGRTRPHVTDGARCVRSARVGRCVRARASVPEGRAGSRLLLLSLSHAPCVVRARGGGGAPGRRRRPSCAGVCRRPGRAGRVGEARGCGENEVCCDLAPSEFPKHPSPPTPSPALSGAPLPPEGSPLHLRTRGSCAEGLAGGCRPRTEERGPCPLPPPLWLSAPPLPPGPPPRSPGCKLRGPAPTRVWAGNPRRAAVQRPGHPH